MIAIIEVVALCGFVFGVACKVPPALTILLLNGCFCFPIGFHLFEKFQHFRSRSRRQEYQQLDGNSAGYLLNMSHKTLALLSILEIIALIMQFCVVVFVLPVILWDKLEEHKNIYVVIILPVSLVLISLVWSGKIQQTVSRYDDKITARLKAGMLIRIIHLCSAIREYFQSIMLII